jgi:hypothetical protein
MLVELAETHRLALGCKFKAAAEHQQPQPQVELLEHQQVHAQCSKVETEEQEEEGLVLAEQT